MITTEYAGNYIYEAGFLQFFNTAEGNVEPKGTGWEYVFQYKDHPSASLRAGLGNIRLSYADADGNGIIVQTEIREENNYYPFCLKHIGYNNVINGGRDHKFEYNGQETEESLGLNVTEMSFRQYDPAIGRFNSIDRLAELAPGITPFRFGFNNPIAFNDPTGLMETIRGETVGADGITNSQWVALSRPGGGGFDAIAKQRQQNSCELRGNCQPGQNQQEENVLNKKKKFYLPKGRIDFNAPGKRGGKDPELYRIYDVDGRTAHVFYASFFLENELVRLSRDIANNSNDFNGYSSGDSFTNRNEQSIPLTTFIGDFKFSSIQSTTNGEGNINIISTNGELSGSTFKLGIIPFYLKFNRLGGFDGVGSKWGNFSFSFNIRSLETTIGYGISANNITQRVSISYRPNDNAKIAAVAAGAYVGATEQIGGGYLAASLIGL